MLKVFSLYTLLIIINFLLTKQLECEHYEVGNCIKCDKEKQNCKECVSGLFPSYGGLKCSYCNDTNDGGQIACVGSCSKDSDTGMVLCENCKTGYYSINGICTLCSIGSPNCIRCSYKASPGSTQKIYTCLECINDEYAVSVIDGICRQCPLPQHCSKCRYPPGSHESTCILCQSGYYLYNGVCYQCSYQNKIITGGICSHYYCPNSSDHNKIGICNCNYGYILTPQYTCISCPSNCEQCEYNQGAAKCIKCLYNYALSPQNTCTHCQSNCLSCYYDQNILKCSICETRYALLNYQCSSCGAHCISCNFDQNILKCNSCEVRYALLNYQCSSCGDHCLTCYFSNNNTAICTQCGDGYILTDKQICEYLSVPAHCNSYQNRRFNNRNEVICNSCYSYYTLDSTDNKCLDCPSHCTYCYLDNNNNFVCEYCDYDYVLNDNKLCEPCASNATIGGEGCIHCKYENNRNKCTQCRSDYIFIRNEDVCKLPSEINLNETCYEANRLPNGEYSCISCRAGNYTLVTRFNGISDCYLSKNELENCILAYEDEYQNLTCNKCIYNYQFIWSLVYQKNVCDNKCAYDNFFNYNEDIRGCYKCDDESGGGQIGCDPEYGCGYIAADNHNYCNVCKPRYFLYDWQCLNCSKKDINCLECDFNSTTNKFKCTKCIDNTFFVNETGYCQLITYDEYPEVTVGCILPNNNYTTYIENKKCFSCKKGFFKTKEESCVYCLARKNGGPKCEQCKYMIDINGHETNIIDCKICNMEVNIWSPIGSKCYRCQDEVGPGCANCTIEQGTGRVMCAKCQEDYEPNDEGYCTSKKSYERKIPNCLIYEDSISNISTALRLLANVKSCKICNDGYYVENGRCKKIYLDTCSLKTMYNLNRSIYNECIKFCEMNYYPIVDYKDNNERILNILKNNLKISNDSSEIDIKDIIENGKFCINNINEDIELRKCIKIEYDLNKKNYKCSKCVDGYELVNSNNRCVQKLKLKKISQNKNVIMKLFLFKQKEAHFAKSQ